MSEAPRTISRADVTTKIEARLGGTLAVAALANWAFDRFYAEELGSERYETGFETVIANALDALMFSNDPGFGLDATELQALITQLR